MFIPIHDDNPLRSIRWPWVTWVLIALNLAVFALEFTTTGEAVMASFAIVPSELFKAGMFGGPALGVGDVWAVPERVTLFSYMFMHGDSMHVATNMLFLWVFGDNVEDALGHARYIVFYIVCGLAAGLAHAFAAPASQLPLIGASGAIAGIVAAYVMLHPSVKVWVLAFRFIPLNLSAAIVLGLWIAVQFAMLFVRDASFTAWWAHVGGIVAGACLVTVLRRPGFPLFDRWRTGASVAQPTPHPPQDIHPQT